MVPEGPKGKDPEAAPAPENRKLPELLVGDWESVGGGDWKVSQATFCGLIHAGDANAKCP